MARFGEWRPLAANWASQSRMTQTDIISLHTAVGSLAGTESYFRKAAYTGSHSHFGVGGYGECWQWQDTAYRAAANYNGNWHIISVETADRGAPFANWNINDGGAVPAWTDAQIETLAQLVAAMCRAHNIPCVLIPDAKPGRRGIGYHRMGVPGYMVAGAEQWSTATGKVCPGNRRIAQVPRVIARAQQILSPKTEDDLTPEQDAMLRAIHHESTALLPSRVPGSTYKDTVLGYAANADAYGAGISKQLAVLQAAVDKLAGAVAGGDTVTADELRAVVQEAMSSVVQVKVSVDPPSA